MKKSKMFIVAVLFCMFFLISCNQNVDLSAVDKNSNEELIIEVPNGSTAKSVSEILEKNKVIKSRGSFMYYLKQNKLSDKLQAGKYQFSKSMDVKTIADKIVNGEVYTNTVRVLIPEGYEFNMIADKLVQDLSIDKDIFINLANNHEFKQKFMKYVPKYDKNSGVKFRLEGYLFPATYTFKRDISELEILNTMLDRFDTEITDEYYQSLENNPLDFNEIITLASIVEREGASYEEFPIIAGVFMNRVDSGMLFQSCATVQYVIAERKPVLANNDIKLDNPYNTYKYPGLPPSPIACPGSVALKAAFFPQKNDYFYFVVSGKNDGKHTFSKTLSEHEKAKKQNLK